MTTGLSAADQCLTVAMDDLHEILCVLGDPDSTNEAEFAVSLQWTPRRIVALLHLLSADLRGWRPFRPSTDLQTHISPRLATFIDTFLTHAHDSEEARCVYAELCSEVTRDIIQCEGLQEELEDAMRDDAMGAGSDFR